jgi:hypothetical protein
MRATFAVLVSFSALVGLFLVPMLEMSAKAEFVEATMSGGSSKSLFQLAHPVRTAQQYSFCGACTANDACGPGNLCCRGDCAADKKKCYAVSTCP